MIPVARRGRIETYNVKLFSCFHDPRRKTGKNRNGCRLAGFYYMAIPVARRGRIETARLLLVLQAFLIPVARRGRIETETKRS